MYIYLWKFTKRENSTARPASQDATTISGLLREPCDIMAPVVGFNFGTSAAPDFNYAYIPDFSRDYFIDGWTWDAGLWYASMKIDVLATWRGTIGASSQYVLRSSAASDGNIVDTLYPAKNSTQRITGGGIASPFSGSLGGDYIIGVLNGDTSAVGGVSYYAMSSASLKSLLNTLLSTTSWTGFVDGDSDLTEAVYKSLFNPLQYIVSCMYSPIAADVGGSSTLKLGWFTTNASAARLNSSYVAFSKTLSVPAHPQASARGAYLNGAPFRKLWLEFPGFGTIPLDADSLIGRSSLDVYGYYDYISGMCRLEVDSSAYGCQQILETQVGVPVMLGQVTQDVGGTMMQTVSAGGNLLGAIGQAVTGDISGALNSVIGAGAGIVSATQSMAPQVMTIGTNGSYAKLSGSCMVSGLAYMIVDEDNADLGRPLCKVKTISDIPGYIQVDHPDIAIYGTDFEAQQIRAYMAAGFFYE